MKTILFIWTLTSSSYQRETTFDWRLLAEVGSIQECVTVAKALAINPDRYRCITVKNPNR